MVLSALKKTQPVHALGCSSYSIYRHNQFLRHMSLILYVSYFVSVTLYTISAYLQILKLKILSLI